MEGAVEPRLEVVELKMDQGQDHPGILGVALHDGFMLELLARTGVAGLAIGKHVCARSQAGLDKGLEVGGAGRGEHGYLGVAGQESCLLYPQLLFTPCQRPLDGHDYQNFVFVCQTSSAAALATLAAIVGFVNFDSPSRGKAP